MQEFKQVMKGRIFDILFKQKMVEPEFFMCGEYIAKLLVATIQEPPTSWYAVDYILGTEKGQEHVSWQNAADLCFLICSIFEKRSEFRAMSYKDYANMGRTFYHIFSDKSKKEIGWMMSVNYHEMVEITKTSFSFSV